MGIRKETRAPIVKRNRQVPHTKKEQSTINCTSKSIEMRAQRSIPYACLCLLALCVLSVSAQSFLRPDPCACRESCRSGGYCYVRGGSRCRSARPSTRYPGSYYKTCTPSRPASNACDCRGSCRSGGYCYVQGGRRCRIARPSQRYPGYYYKTCTPSSRPSPPSSTRPSPPSSTRPVYETVEKCYDSYSVYVRGVNVPFKVLNNNQISNPGRGKCDNMLREYAQNYLQKAINVQEAISSSSSREDLDVAVNVLKRSGKASSRRSSSGSTRIRYRDEYFLASPSNCRYNLRTCQGCQQRRGFPYNDCRVKGQIAGSARCDIKLQSFRPYCKKVRRCVRNCSG